MWLYRKPNQTSAINSEGKCILHSSVVLLNALLTLMKILLLDLVNVQRVKTLKEGENKLELSLLINSGLLLILILTGCSEGIWSSPTQIQISWGKTIRILNRKIEYLDAKWGFIITQQEMNQENFI